MNHARRTYSQFELLSAYIPARRPSPDVVGCIRALGLWTLCVPRRRIPAAVGFGFARYRGRRSGRRRPVLPLYRPVGNGASIIVGNRPSPKPTPPLTPPTPTLVSIHLDRHTSVTDQLMFGSINIRSIANKLDDLREVWRDADINVMLLTETWHDSDSVSFRRLRAEGYQVVDRPRPRRRDDTMSTNHGGVAVAAVAGVRLTKLDLGVAADTFEYICVRVATDQSAASCIVLLMYRPGSEAVTSTFFDEFTDVLDRAVTFVDPVYVAGDINIRLDRADDASTIHLVEVLSDHGLACRVSSPTHDRGGLLDVVATRDDLPPPAVSVDDVGLSDHRLLRWSVPLHRPCPSYVTTTSRPWRQLDSDVFRAAIQSSPLSCPARWQECVNIDDMIQLYDVEMTAILDRLVPSRSVTCRQRPSDPWFDQDCRDAKRRVRTLERAYRRIDRNDTAAVVTAAAAWNSERRSYRLLLHQKREEFWRYKVDAERSTPRRLWQSVDTLLGRGRVPLADSIDADTLHRFFDDKVAGVRAATDDAPPPTFVPVRSGCSFTQFSPVTADVVVAAVKALSDKQCASDPLPTRLLKDNIDLLAPFLVELFNRSLLTGSVPAAFKDAYVTPRLKKADLDPSDTKSYRPISNLSVLSKLLERLVARQLLDYLTTEKLLPDLQSAYRSFHSTETAVLKVMSDILRALDNGDIALLTLLDLSAAFDTVDHAILLKRLEVSYGLNGHSLGWFVSYLTGRRQCVRCRNSRSLLTVILCGVPQGSVLGPILFLLYTADLVRLVESHHLHPHLYADDTQVYGFSHPSAASQLQLKLLACVEEVSMWMRSNRLQLNPAKTEVLWLSSSRMQFNIPQSAFSVGNNVISSSPVVRDLGIYLDSGLTMTAHISKTVSNCFAALRQIRSVRRSLPTQVTLSLVIALVLTRLDCGNAVLAGLPARQLNRLQSVLHAAARLIYRARKFDHVTPLLRELHWLSVPERITFKLATLVFRCLHGLAPAYLAEAFNRAADVESRCRLRSGSSSALLVPTTRRRTLGDRAFAVAGARVWNSLPATLTSQPSLLMFRRQLKTLLFEQSFS